MRLHRPGLTGLLLASGGLLLVLLAAGSATAAYEPALTVDVEPASGGDQPLEPGGEEETWEWTLTYRTHVPPVQEVDIHLDVHDRMFEGTVTPSTVTIEPPPNPDKTELPRAYEFSGTLTFTAPPHAPAYTAQRQGLCAESQGWTVVESARWCTDVTVMAGWSPGLEVEQHADRHEFDVGEEIHLRADVMNLGNGPATVTFEEATPEACDLDPLHEEATLADYRSTRDVVFHLSCDEAVEDDVQVTFQQAYGPDESLKTASQTVTWKIAANEGTDNVQAAALVLGLFVGTVGVGRWAGRD